MLDSWPKAQQLHCAGTCDLHLASWENRPFMVNFGDPLENIPYPPEFTKLVPNIGPRALGNRSVILKLNKSSATVTRLPDNAVPGSDYWTFTLSFKGFV
ncbi:hypothetical protein R1flu_015902 [Riccia fluitans]|uniref:Uncharacterized protein n=1 Tax=Riccia fluitans TaxID=41844 RepID=A0ABD1YKA4_9MARC